MQPTFLPTIRTKWDDGEASVLIETVLDGDAATVRLFLSDADNAVTIHVDLAPLREILAALLPSPQVIVSTDLVGVVGADTSPTS